MKKTSLRLLKNAYFISLIIFSNQSLAGQITVDTATSYPYKNLINRTDVVKILYTTTEGIHKCKVEIVLNSMKWVSVEEMLKKMLLMNIFYITTYLSNKLRKYYSKNLSSLGEDYSLIAIATKLFICCMGGYDNNCYIEY